MVVVALGKYTTVTVAGGASQKIFSGAQNMVAMKVRQACPLFSMS